MSQLKESFKRMGLTESEAREAARGRDYGPAGKPLKEAPGELIGEEQKLMESFQSMGLTEVEAEEAAKGRHKPKRKKKTGQQDNAKLKEVY